jgi:hypothetical protein
MNHLSSLFHSEHHTVSVWPVECLVSHPGIAIVKQKEVRKKATGKLLAKVIFDKRDIQMWSTTNFHQHYPPQLMLKTKMLKESGASNGYKQIN